MKKKLPLKKKNEKEVCWNKMCLTLPLSFDDNKILKVSIGYANICSSMQDHRQKFSVSLKHRF